MSLEDYIGNEYNIYNPEVLRRFKTDMVRIRIENIWFDTTFQCSVVFPREHDGEFLLCSVDAITTDIDNE